MGARPIRRRVGDLGVTLNLETDKRFVADVEDKGHSQGLEELRRKVGAGEQIGCRRHGFEGNLMRGDYERSSDIASPGPAVAQGPAVSAAVSSGSGLTTQSQLFGADGSSQFVVSGTCVGCTRKKSRGSAPVREGTRGPPGRRESKGVRPCFGQR